MKRDSINYTLVGTLVLISMTLLLYAMARLSGNTDQHDEYFTSFPNVAGIADGTPVTFDGFQVGRVHAVEPLAKEGRLQYRVSLFLKQHWKIPIDSSASISASGLLSGQLIDIAQGKSTNYLKPGQDIVGVDAPALMAGLGGLVSDLRDIAHDDVRPMLKNVSPVLQDLRPVLQDVRIVLKNINQQTTSVSGLIKQKGTLTLDQANTALTKLTLAAENLGQMLNADNRQHVDNILKNGAKTTEQVSQALADFQQTESDLRYAMQQTQTILANLERASRHMNELSRQLHESPSAIFRSPAPVELVETEK
ncbi:MlaD family protein [Rhodoferax sp.]|uniref:MlaD family protein n=1 Tax=Rhodoferax sp. TaxID=50421 RepID=UPI0008B3AFBC|nr:MlaD family protein [Rhodoferax sp.]MDO8320444.1 MlaD family protein [Rhodoferax sp.]OGB79683.1 MAG: hypothetical protein A2496_02055 [Burkholderiales bacterium RIFOXYC12_FULL_60_6]